MWHSFVDVKRVKAMSTMKEFFLSFRKTQKCASICWRKRRKETNTEWFVGSISVGTTKCIRSTRRGKWFSLRGYQIQYAKSRDYSCQIHSIAVPQHWELLLASKITISLSPIDSPSSSFVHPLLNLNLNLKPPHPSSPTYKTNTSPLANSKSPLYSRYTTRDLSVSTLLIQHSIIHHLNFASLSHSSSP